LEQKVVEKASRFRDELGDIEADTKTVRDENLHLTVKFLGEIDESRIGQVDSVQKAVEDVDPFELEIEGTGAFPSMDYIRVVWIGTGKGSERFREIISNAERTLVNEGFPENKNDPVPHATVCRVSSGRNKDAIRRTIEKWNKRSFGKMVVDRVSLFESKLTPTGPVYTKIKDYLL